MDKIVPWLSDNQYWLMPLVIYIALNVSKRTKLLTSANPTVRAIAVLIEPMLVLEWDKWGGKFKSMDPPP
jgi:hypothetical protein